MCCCCLQDAMEETSDAQKIRDASVSHEVVARLHVLPAGCQISCNAAEAYTDEPPYLQDWLQSPPLEKMHHGQHVLRTCKRVSMPCHHRKLQLQACVYNSLLWVSACCPCSLPCWQIRESWPKRCVRSWQKLDRGRFVGEFVLCLRGQTSRCQGQDVRRQESLEKDESFLVHLQEEGLGQKGF